MLGLKATSDEVLQEGSGVVVYEGFTCKKFALLKPGEWTYCKYGRWKHDTLIGKKYGDKVEMKVKERGVEFPVSAFLLKPTMEMWTECLHHRTQILYACDIAVVCSRLDLKPGKVVVEAGTGSGSLSHSLARAVHPGGQLYTFDFHEDRSKTAAKEFESHGLGGVVKAAHRDVCKQREEGMKSEDWGFGLAPGTADALFLDVPSPWLAVEAVHETLRNDGIFCNYSPCIEQVQRVCDKLRELGFANIRTHEVLKRELTEQTNKYRPLFGADVACRAKKRKLDGEGDSPSPEPVPEEEKQEQEKPVEAKEYQDMKLLVPIQTSRGHTGYLTFAHKAPQVGVAP